MSEADEAIQSFPWLWIASLSLSSGAHSRDPLARNDVLKTRPAVVCDGRPVFGVQEVLRRLRDATLTGLMDGRGFERLEVT